MGNILAMKVEGGVYVLGVLQRSHSLLTVHSFQGSLSFPRHRFGGDIEAHEKYYHCYCHPIRVILQGCLGHLGGCEETHHPSYWSCMYLMYCLACFCLLELVFG